MTAAAPPPLTYFDWTVRSEVFHYFASFTEAPTAEVWYAGRLDPDWRGRSAQASQEVLESVGLTGEFWQLV